MKKLAFVMLTVVPLLALSVEVSAQPGWGHGSWQAVGATGTPDEYATFRVLLQDNGFAEIRPDISSTSIKLRYNIPPLEGLRGYGNYSDDYSGYELRVLARDNGPSAQVIVKIKSMSWDDGTVLTLAEFDSDKHTPPDGLVRAFLVYLRDETGPMKFFRPYHRTYWAEVHLIKTGPDGKPGIAALGVLIDES